MTAPTAERPRPEWRPVPWSAVWHHRAPLLLAGATMLLAGTVWLATIGALPRLFELRDRTVALPVGALILPGLALAGLWLRAAMSLKVLLATGAEAAARVTDCRRTEWFPGRVAIGFGFTPRGAAPCTARIVTGATTAVARAAREAAPLSAVYDPGRPQHCGLRVAPTRTPGA